MIYSEIEGDKIQHKWAFQDIDTIIESTLLINLFLLSREKFIDSLKDYDIVPFYRLIDKCKKENKCNYIVEHITSCYEKYWSSADDYIFNIIPEFKSTVSDLRYNYLYGVNEIVELSQLAYLEAVSQNQDYRLFCQIHTRF